MLGHKRTHYFGAGCVTAVGNTETPRLLPTLKRKMPRSEASHGNYQAPGAIPLPIAGSAGNKMEPWAAQYPEFYLSSFNRGESNDILAAPYKSLGAVNRVKRPEAAAWAGGPPVDPFASLFRRCIRHQPAHEVHYLGEFGAATLGPQGG